jgi:CxxC motif-containing protein (DUF1111 family)
MTRTNQIVRFRACRAALTAAAWLATCALTIALTPQDPQEDPQVARGREQFRRAFHLADGLGAPEMNGDTCAGCHRDPVVGGAGPLEVNVTHFGRDQLGTQPFINLPGGPALSKLRPPMSISRENAPFNADVFEQRQTPSILGDGLIETINGAVITANEDPLDANQDGIFGVARRINVDGTIEIGRYGWKAQIPKLRDFVQDAMFGEMGLTTPSNGRGFNVPLDGDDVPDPEVSDTQVDDIAAYLRSLAAPQRGGSTDPRVADGRLLFDQVGCAICHIPELAGANGPVPLYSNLLLHNVMPEGFRGVTDAGSDVGFYRTPPLWGISKTAPYMHDGRAEDLRGAILAHFSEAEQVRLNFEALDGTQQESLILFLEDL